MTFVLAVFEVPPVGVKVTSGSASLSASGSSAVAATAGFRAGSRQHIVTSRAGRLFELVRLYQFAIKRDKATVLLTTFEERARERSWTTVEAEITKNTDFGGRMAQLARRALLQLAPRARWKDRAKRAAAVLSSFQVTVSPDGSVTAGIGVDALEGVADSGELAEDLTDLLIALVEAAADCRTPGGSTGTHRARWPSWDPSRNRQRT
ncbi:MAG: hypothetical protein ACRDL1_02410 [Solirubrobacterales bacterium]